MNDKLFKIVDIVIMTYRPSQKFVLLLESLLNQSYNINKIYIINTNEDEFYINLDNLTKTTVKELLNNKIINLINIKSNEFDHGASRNIILKYSNADYVVFFTNDAVPYDNNLINNLVEGIDKDISIKASYARQIPFNNAYYKEKLIRGYNYPNYDIIKSKDTLDLYGIKNYYMSNVCAIYDYKYFKQNNGFKENIILNEDTYFAYKIINDGYKVLYNSKVLVYHSHNYSYIKQFKRYFDIGVSHNEDEIVLKNIDSNKEGFYLFKKVIFEMLKHFKLFETLDFIIDLIFRFIGFTIGKNYKYISKNLCLKFTMNKNYFLRNK